MKDRASHNTATMRAGFARGAIYVSVATWITYGINFVVVLAVARILGPEAFGLYAFVVALNGLIDIVNALGVAPALVQSRKESESLYDTGYAMSFGQGLIGLLVALMAAPILWTTRSPEAAWFIVLLGIARILSLLTDVAFVRLDRHVRYGPIAVIHLTTRSIPSFVCLGLAWLGWGPLSLIVRDLLLAALAFTVAHWWARHGFRGRLDRDSFRRIMSFSGPMFVSGTLEIVLQRLDRFVIGSLFGNAALGLYHQARFIAETGHLVAAPSMRVTFNLYSRLQDDPARRARSYSIVAYFLVRIFFGGAVVLLVYPEEVIRLLLGEEWIEAAPILRILGLYVALLPLLNNMKILLFARAAVLTNVRLRLMQLAVFLPGVLLAGWMGSMNAVAASLLASTLVGVVLASYFNREVVGGARPLYATPAIALVATLSVFWGLESSRLLQDLPYWALPFLPPLAFWALVATLDRGRLVDEVRYLRTQLLRSERPRTANGVDAAAVE